MDNPNRDAADDFLAQFDRRGDVLQLRFSDGAGATRTLNAAHVAEALQGLVGLASDFAKAGAFGRGIPQDLEVRPAREGSFILEVVNWVALHQDEIATGASIGGAPTLAQVVSWSTKSARAKPKAAEYLDSGNVMITWSDDTIDEVPADAWAELNKRKRRRKKQLREIMAALSTPEVEIVEVRSGGGEDAEIDFTSVDPVVVLDNFDYRLAAPEDEIDEEDEIFETEASMVTIDFEDGGKWRVRIPGRTARLATLEDEVFLQKVAEGLALHKDDIYRLKIREDRTTKNGRTSREWTVLRVISHRRTQ